jgi:endonuclease/exonuclease/phosphatase family metal-dependent hydrolase
LRVVSYNVHGLRDDRGALTEAVRALAPDVLIVQEAPRRLRWRTRCATLAHDFGLLYASGGLPALGNLILVGLRVRVHDTWALRYPLTPGRHLRGAAFARCTVDRVPFVVAGSHLATDPVERPGQAALLAGALAPVTEPVILGGDLNENPGGKSWELLAAGRLDAGRDGGGTYPVPEPRERIDALLVDPRIEVTRYEVVDTPAARRASDHFPIVADLTLPA